MDHWSSWTTTDGHKRIQNEANRQKHRLGILCWQYGEILEAYSAHYPSLEDAAAIGKDFQHKKDELRKSVLTSKLKAIWSKYRQVVDNGRRSGHGRVLMIFYQHCSEIWAGSPATAAMSDGLESSENHEESSNQRSFEAYSNSMEKLTSNMEKLTGSISDGFALLQRMMCQPLNNMNMNPQFMMPSHHLQMYPRAQTWAQSTESRSYHNGQFSYTQALFSDNDTTF